MGQIQVTQAACLDVVEGLSNQEVQECSNGCLIIKLLEGFSVDSSKISLVNACQFAGENESDKNMELTGGFNTLLHSFLLLPITTFLKDFFSLSWPPSPHNWFHFFSANELG